MADISFFIRSHLLDPLKNYPTIIQDTMIELIIQKLQLLYDYATKFPEIVSPNSNRLDILKAIADQFLFSIRKEADLQQQIDILDNILYVYSKRGSIDTIENMWKYYGGDLPKDVKVVIPSYNLFRYSISKLSGTHVFQDNGINRTGVYEIKLINNRYPIPDLKEFLIKELVAAGNYIYFTNTLHMNVLNDGSDVNPYTYLVYEDTTLQIQLEVLKARQGLTWSGYNPLSKKSEDSAWSGRGSIFLEITKIFNIDEVLMNTYRTYQDIGIQVSVEPTMSEVLYTINSYRRYTHLLDLFLYCTPTVSSHVIARNLYNSQGELIISKYPGFFILAESLLGDAII